MATNLTSFEKLKGRSNYSEWQYSAKNYLICEGLWNSVEGTEADAEKNQKALAKIGMLVEPINFCHIQAATTSKQAWTNLQTAFEDKGLYRRVSLLRPF